MSKSSESSSYQLDQAKSLSSPSAVEARREGLAAAHMVPLVEFVRQLREVAPAGVPDFDPLDGGVNAECLFLLEAPGRRAVGSGFVSRNNPDETAKNFFTLNAEAGLQRSRTLTWNAIPWYIGNGQRIRPATRYDLFASQRHLRDLIALLPLIRVVVLVGRKAGQNAAAIREIAPSAQVLTCPHPSPLSLNGRPGRRQEVLDCLVQVAQLLANGERSVV